MPYFSVFIEKTLHLYETYVQRNRYHNVLQERFNFLNLYTSVNPALNLISEEPKLPSKILVCFEELKEVAPTAADRLNAESIERVHTR